MQVLQGQLAVIELAVGKDLVDQGLHQAPYAGGGWIGDAARGGLHLIGQHHQRGFPRLRPGTGISEIVDVDGFRTFLLFGLVVEIRDQTGAVMLLNGVDDRLPQTVLPGDLDRKSTRLNSSH